MRARQGRLRELGSVVNPSELGDECTFGLQLQ
jgi:hypothetical protein